MIFHTHLDVVVHHRPLRMIFFTLIVLSWCHGAGCHDNRVQNKDTLYECCMLTLLLLCTCLDVYLPGVKAGNKMGYLPMGLVWLLQYLVFNRIIQLLKSQVSFTFQNIHKKLNEYQHCRIN